MSFHPAKLFAAVARWFCLAWGLVALSGAARAEPVVPGRWLLVFDTSATMKKCLPATLAAANRLLAASAGGQLQEGDSVAVWIYDQQVLPSQLAPVSWAQTRSSLLSSNLAGFLNRQRFQADSRLAALQAPLARVIADSERLTIVVFCDGQSPINFTPYDAGVNQCFKDGLDGRKKGRQPFALVFRTQLGKYVGCTVNYPPRPVSFPPFPELPPPPVTKPTTTTPKAPVIVPPVAPTPSLVIIGRSVGTNVNAVPEEAPPVARTNIAASVHTQAQITNPPAPIITVPAPTNEPAPVKTPPPPPAVAPTKPNAAVPDAGPPAANVEKSQVAPAPQPAKVVDPVATNMVNAAPVMAGPPSNPPVVVAVAAAPVTAPAPPPVPPPVPPPATPPVAAPVVPPVTAAEVPRPAVTPNAVVAATQPGDDPMRLLVWLGVGLLAAAAVLVAFLLVRGNRQPPGSLISRSMEHDPRRK